MDRKRRYYVMTRDLTGPLEGTFDDWPANVQDGMLEGLEDFERRKNAKFEVVQVVCAEDPDKLIGFPGRFYLRVELREVFPGEDKEFDPYAAAQELHEDVRKLLN